MVELKCAMWNCGGLRASSNSTPLKMGFFDKTFPNANLDIAALVETHHRNEEDFPDLVTEYSVTHNIIHTPTPETHSHSGIILMINKDFDIESSEVLLPGRILNVHIKHKIHNETYNLSAYYGIHVQNMTISEMENIGQIFLNAHHHNDNNIIIGDFNFIENELDKAKGMDPRDRNMNKEWIKVKSHAQIEDPMRVQYPKKKVYSFVGPMGKSRGDRLYVNEELTHLITNYTYEMTPFNGAHKILRFRLANQQPRGAGIWKLNTSILNDPLYSNLVEDTISNTDRLNVGDPRVWWEIFLNAIKCKTVTYCKTKKAVERSVINKLKADLRLYEKIPFKTMTKGMQEHYVYLKEKYRAVEEVEVEGYRVRTRNLPKYEPNEPNIAFYAKLEQRCAKRSTIGNLMDQEGNVTSDPNSLKETITQYYTKLYSPSPIDPRSQDTLLKNVNKHITVEQRDMLDAEITDQELQQAVNDLNNEKSPGIDGLPAEFYKKFWTLLKDKYKTFIFYSYDCGFTRTKNTSVNNLLYKKGDTVYLKNYRPLSLINTDMKIISKVLTNRLKTVLPTIIHQSQTAVDGRKIDHTIHLLRDLIDLANKEESEAAFIFLDQEKAFDRVDHNFLFKTMSTFGIGDRFLKWIKQMYANAHTRIKINGSLTNPIPLRRGVRQGDPLSPLLYIFTIELLALQFRQNPNIVGFTVGGDKIISQHYADDATITITQNRCFKEVIKDIATYEKATGAKINYDKTKGLWVGKWKGRTDTPLDIKWTSGNTQQLGVYLGNDNPAKATFDTISPKLKQALGYWRQFRLSKLAKARVIEIFHASRLWFAAKFYPIPLSIVKELQKAFFDYFNFPLHQVTVKQQEAHKSRLEGGANLINIQHKSEASMIQWIMELATNPELKLHETIMTRLIGPQRGALEGIELFFTTEKYTRYMLKISPGYYKEAIRAISRLDVRKKVRDLDNEKIFYNPIFTRQDGRILTPNKYCIDNNITTFGQITQELIPRVAGQDVEMTTLLPYDINVDMENRNEHTIITDKGLVKFKEVAQKAIYQQISKRTQTDHHSSAKWVERLELPIDWKKVWESVHNPLATEETKTVIWEQIHLNNYTTANFNKWHGSDNPCPLCKNTGINRFHITLECPMVIKLWEDIEPFLKQIHPNPISDEEKVFGLIGTTPKIQLRNWFTFLLRELIAQQEYKAYYMGQRRPNTRYIKMNFNARVRREVLQAHKRYTHMGRLDIFVRRYASDDVFLSAMQGTITDMDIPPIFQ